MRLLNASQIERFIYYLILLLLPTQFGKHFWPPFSYVFGLRIDYLSPTLYATDMLVGLLFSYCLYRLFLRQRTSMKAFFFEKNAFLVSFFFFLIGVMTGILLSKSPIAGWYGFLKLFEFLFFGLYTAYFFKKETKKKLAVVAVFFTIGIFYESFLAVVQFFHHGSIGGVWYFLGERSFNSQTPGIANASIDGTLVLRPYGTLPHPNVLAGYLLLAMGFLAEVFDTQRLPFQKVALVAALTSGTLALFITLSRAAILLWFLYGLFIVVHWLWQAQRKKKQKARLVVFVLLLGIMVLITTTPLRSRITSLSLTDEAVVVRKDLLITALQMTLDHPFFGVGLNNFLINLVLYQRESTRVSTLQPVHNIFFLVASQTGIVGLFFFLWFLQKLLTTAFKAGRASLLLSVVVLGLFDHYFLTLQQGQLLFSFVLGFCCSASLSLPNEKTDKMVQ